METHIAQIQNEALGDLAGSFGGEGGGAAFVSALVGTVVTILLVVGALYFVIQLLTGGIDWMRAGSDKAQLEAARGKLANALIGLIILFSAWAVFTLLGNIFGINLLLLNIPTLQNAGS